MSSSIQACFEKWANEKHKALIPFLTAGDPTPQATVLLMHCLVENGADLIEIGVPFSDPMADGPVIQRASERALAHHVNMEMIFNMVAKFRSTDKDTPIVLMSYLNPIAATGYEIFVNEAVAAGVNGVLVTDLPPEEAGELNQLARQQEIDQVFLVAPTTSAARLQYILEMASGFLYYVSLKGVTGHNQLDMDMITSNMFRIRSATNLPVGIGFGIKNAKSAAAMGKLGDAVIIGSTLVEKIAKHAAITDLLLDDVARFMTVVRAALDAV